MGRAVVWYQSTITHSPVFNLDINYMIYVMVVKYDLDWWQLDGNTTLLNIDFVRAVYANTTLRYYEQSYEYP